MSSKGKTNSRVKLGIQIICMFDVNALRVKDFTCLMRYGPEKSWHKFPLE